MKKLYKSLAILFVFIITLTQAKAFTDVPEDSWFAPYVKELATAGIIDNGDKFRPEDDLNRAEFVKMVIKGIKEEGKEVLPGHPTFDDVRLTDWFAPFVERAATLGIVSGYADPEGNLTGWFGPGDDVTRAQAVKILVEALDLKAGNKISPLFNDVTTNDWFFAYVSVANNLGIVEGYEGGLFKPNQAVKRSEMAAMLSRAMAIASNPALPYDGANPENPEDPENNENPSNNEGPTDEEPIDSNPENQPQEGVKFKANPAALNSDILVPDQKEKYIGQYSFKGLLEGFTVNTLTLVNDKVGNHFGDDAESSSGIKNITLKFADKNGFLRTATSPLKTDGTARFTNLNFFVKRDVSSPLEIYVTLNSFSEVGEALSGETFRLGIQDVDNDTNSFKATGDSSKATITLGDDGLNQSTSNTELYTIRRSAPTFELVKKTNILSTGTNDLIGLKITADKAGSLSFGRLTFEISVDDQDNANLMLNEFKFTNGSSTVEQTNIYDATGMQDLTQSGGGSLDEGTYKVIVSFDQEEVIPAGEARTYYLKANVLGSDVEDQISTRLATGDEDSALTGLNAVNQENTGKIYVSGDTTAGIFTVSATDFSQLTNNTLNILWSDLSGTPHQYATVAEGEVTSNSGTTDWTNGYRLGATNLGTSILSK